MSKNHSLLILILSILFYSCEEQSGFASQSPSRGKDSFIQKVYFQNGNISKELSFSSDSVLNGECIFYYFRGGIQSKINYRRGIRHGQSITFFPNQKIESRLSYHNGIPHGSFSWYKKDGKLSQKGGYKNGDINGWVEHYFPNGNLQAKYFYQKNRKKGVGFEYFSNGQLRRWHFFNVSGQPGFTMLFNESGKIEETYGDILIDFEVDKNRLSWKNELSLGISVAVPSDFIGEVQVKRQTNGQTFIQKGELTPNQNTWRYRTSELKKTDHGFSISARIESSDSFFLASRVQHFRVDLSGRAPQIYYE